MYLQIYGGQLLLQNQSTREYVKDAKRARAAGDTAVVNFMQHHHRKGVYEWGYLTSPLLEKVLQRAARLAGSPADKLIINPYPAFGNKTMAINHASPPLTPNCSYCHVLYKGFPYVVLITLEAVAEGTELLADYGKGYFESRKVFYRMLPALDVLLDKPDELSHCCRAVWAEHKCVQENQVYFYSCSLIRNLQVQVESEWSKQIHDTPAIKLGERHAALADYEKQILEQLACVFSSLKPFRYSSHSSFEFESPRDQDSSASLELGSVPSSSSFSSSSSMFSSSSLQSSSSSSVGSFCSSDSQPRRSARRKPTAAPKATPEAYIFQPHNHSYL